VPESLKATRVRAWINLGIAGLLAALALIILPGALLAVFAEDGALHMGVLVGLAPGELVLLDFLLCFCALVLGSWGIHELRGVEKRAEEQASEPSGESTTQVGIESSGSLL
jgi:membrane protein implicated in regulation of membrane protease activity